MKPSKKKKLESPVYVFQESDKALRAIYESTRSVRFVINRDCTVLLFNKRAHEEFFSLFGIEISVGENISNCFKKNNFTETLNNEIEKALKKETVIKEILLGAGNHKIWHKIYFHPLILEDKTTAISISVRNINGTKIQELKILRQNNLLGHIVFSLSHDVRGPVASILGLLSLLERMELSEKNNEIIALLEVATKHLDKIITTVVRDITNINISA